METEGSYAGSTRERLFLAAVKVFAKKGYRGATVREICTLAGAANLNSIHYYFGGKENLYKAVLETIFADYQKRKAGRAECGRKEISPENRLRDFIHTYCDMLYSGGEVSADLSSIFIAEMSRPSSHIDEMAQKYMAPQAGELMGILRDILGPEAQPDTLRDCGISIIGAIGYYGFTWPLLARIFSDLPAMQSYYPHLAEHVYRFSMGGLRAVKKDLARGRILPPQSAKKRRGRQS